MRFSIGSTLAVATTLALLSSRTTHVFGALNAQERAAIELQEGPNANFCPPCLQKAMHNHFPHACRADLSTDEANARPSGATEEEERCVCLAFRDLFWMKADCSLECHYVHNEKAMKYFLPADKIEGCEKWVDFENNGQEREVEGFAPKNEAHQPEVFEIAPPPPKAEGEEEDEDDDGGYKVSVKITTAEDDAKAKAKLELESGLKPEIEKSKESETEAKADDIKKDEAEVKKDEPEAKKDEL
ncbi:hypothetical protein BGZ70_002311 [Mortierella alpina]|uniref:Uncharacterized protein n=1 Tax=Mortierella alpina TaxID=64518 RepID=A0A9P6IUD2_MORAP|nr:hypothetical protein BGZ70_002311 [Mortierella alpina]